MTRRLFLSLAQRAGQTSANLARYASSASHFLKRVRNRSRNLPDLCERQQQLTLSVPAAQQSNPARELALIGARKRRRPILTMAQTMRVQMGLAPDRRLAG